MISKILDNHKLSLLSLALLITSTHNPANANGLKFPDRNVLLKNAVFQQKVNGKVQSTDGPLAGATIRVKGTSRSTSAGADGSFNIEAKNGDVLVINNIGYKTQEVTVTGAVVNINMESNSEALEEVVIVGYGTQQKKESLTGALQTVQGNKLRDITTPSVENMLNGKAAGVYVAPGTGRPGAKGGVVIRGQASLSGTTSPLWVINGVIVGSSPGDLNPDDIASMTVLKDAASTSIYGSQGANGVIIVTTKNPTAQPLAVTVSTKMGFTELTNGNMQMMNGAELYDYYASFANSSAISFPRWKPELRDSNFDWWKVATKKGFIQNHNISLQGGSEKIQSYLSLGYYNELGAVKGYEYDRYNFRFNTNYKPTDWLTIKPSVVGAKRSVDDRQYSTGAMYVNLPWDSPYDANGNLVPHRYSGWVNGSQTNYLYDLQWNKSANTNYEFMGNLDFDVKITDWLTFSSINNYRYNSYSSSEYTDPRSNGGLSVQGRIGDYRSEYARRYTNQVLRFNKSWGKHALNGIAGYEFNDYWGKTLDVYGKGIVSGIEVLDAAAIPEKTKGGISEWATQSFLSNANYAYDNKYMAQVSFRRDGASNFGTNAKYANFFSVSGGWNVNRENWFKADWVDNLKLRAAYGSVGNRPTALYPQFNLYSVSSSASYNGVPGVLINQIGNKDLTWEQTYTLGGGLDAAFLKNRIRLNVDVYNKKTDNILYRVPISGLTGVTSVWKNVGKMTNKGIELTIGGDIIRSNDLTWSLDVNLGHNTNKLTDLFPSRDAAGNLVAKPLFVSDGLNIAGSAEKILEVGTPIDTYYMREWAGVNTDDGKPMWYKTVKDADGNDTKTTTSNYGEAGLYKVGRSNPKLFGGFNTAVNYKQFDLSAVFGYSLGGRMYNYARQEYDSDGAYIDRNQMKLIDGWNRWEKPGDVATHPVAKYGNTDNGNKVSSRFLEKNDFLRMRSLTIGYNFKLEKYKVKNLRVYFAGENLFTWTKYSGVDPETTINDDGVVMGTAGPSIYPATKKFMFGANLTF
ncbi:SusC/RagA family TonB-linked outer membrane protein [Sphingobacterium detergens]